MIEHRERKTHWLALPFVAFWNFFSFILTTTGRMIAAILGIIFMIIGILLTTTIVAAPVGIPLIIFGLFLMVRSVF